MVSQKYANAMTETLYYLKGISEKDLNKIPKAFINFLNENCAKDYVCNFDYTKPLKDLELLEETRGLISVICLNYWCETPEQKEAFTNILLKNEEEYQKQLREKFNPDNIFKNEIQPEENIVTETALIETKKETWYQKLANLFKKILGKK